MNRHTLTRTLAGLSVIAFGVFALLGSFNAIDFGMLFGVWWPLIIIWVGFLSLINSPKEFGWPLILISAGVLLQLRELDLLHFNVWHLIWPTIIIVVGFSIIFNHGKVKLNKNSKETDSASALLSGHNIKNQSDNYQGGSISAVMGGVKLDLSDAKITKEATLEVFALMGGIEVIVPKTWTVETRITPILGGADNKAVQTDTKNGPKLFIVGEAIMGGIEIKH